MKKMFLFAVGMLLALAQPASATDVAFNYKGYDQRWTVPAGVTQVTVKAWGAGGDFGYDDLGDPSIACRYEYGGGGGYATGVLTVTPGQVLTVRVGGATLDGTTRGWPNGGGGISDVEWMGIDYTYYHGAGGGSSSVKAGTTVLIEAAGGNGSGACMTNGPVAGGGVRTCTPFGNQPGANAGNWAGAGGYCGGGENVAENGGAASSYFPPGGSEVAGLAQDPGNASDPKRNGAGQGGVPNGAYPTHGRVVFTY